MNSFRKILFLIPATLLLIFNFTLAASTEINAKLQVSSETSTPTTTTPIVDGGGGIVNPATVPNFNFSVTNNGNVITVQSSRGVRYVLSLGETNSLERGVVMQGAGFLTDQQIVIPGLLPGQYYYQIQVIDSNGNSRLTGINVLNIPATHVTPPVLNVTGFSARVSGGGGVQMSWNNPSLQTGDYVRVVRSNRFYPTDIMDGDPIYQGTGDSYLDNRGLTEGATYYYSAFVCNSLGNCSSGSTASLLYTGETSIVPPPLIPGKTPVSGETPGGVGEIGNISVYEDGNNVNSANNVFNVKTAGVIKIVSSINIPEGDVRTVTVTIKKTGVSGAEEYSYIANFNTDNNTYETSDFKFDAGGTYEVTVRVFDQNKKVISTRTLTILAEGNPVPPQKDIVESTRDIINSPGGRVTAGAIQFIGLIAGIGLMILQSILATATMTVTSFSDIFLLALRMLGLLFGTNKSRGKPWGTVYDSVTKRPLDPAYVVVTKETGEEVADAITDLDGRYGFLLPNGKYKLKANKTNYNFPTKNLENRTNDEIYNNIYHNEMITVGEGEVVVKNIPLDPIGFDWNEFEKNKQNLFRIYSDREKMWSNIFDGLYSLGIFSSVVATAFDPSQINIIFLSLYIAFILYNRFRKEKRKAVSLKYGKTQEPIPYAIVKVFFAELDNQVKTVVADHLGRFYFLVGPGKYYVTVDEKLPDGTYKRIYKTGTLDLPYGVLNKDIVI